MTLLLLSSERISKSNTPQIFDQHEHDHENQALPNRQILEVFVKHPLLEQNKNEKLNKILPFNNKIEEKKIMQRNYG